MMIRQEIIDYVEREIIPRYDGFDAAHRRDHVLTVIKQSMEFAKQYEVNPEMTYVIAAYHDTGLCEGRENHHRASREIILGDTMLSKWFTQEEIATMGDAAEDHRASAKSEPRTIYGRIVAEADRVIIPESIIRRTIQYTLANYPTLGREEGYERMVEHLNEKYNYGGYLRLWIAESPNAERLERLRQIIDDKVYLRELYDKIYDEEIARG
jgi:uncharacterized protein